MSAMTPPAADTARCVHGAWPDPEDRDAMAEVVAVDAAFESGRYD